MPFRSFLPFAISVVVAVVVFVVAGGGISLPTGFRVEGWGGWVGGWVNE